jgi:hypothetical protein
METNGDHLYPLNWTINRHAGRESYVNTISGQKACHFNRSNLHIGLQEVLRVHIPTSLSHSASTRSWTVYHPKQTPLQHVASIYIPWVVYMEMLTPVIFTQPLCLNPSSVWRKVGTKSSVILVFIDQGIDQPGHMHIGKCGVSCAEQTYPSKPFLRTRISVCNRYYVNIRVCESALFCIIDIDVICGTCKQAVYC